MCNKLYGIMSISLVLVIILFAFCDIHFATNDDTVMVDIASGGYGTPLPYLSNIHIILGWVYVWLFTHVLGVNWITISYILTYYISFCAIGYAIDLRLNNGIKLVVFSVFVIASASYFTFTIVAFVAAIAGIMLYDSSLDDSAGNGKVKMVALLIVTLAVLFRAEVIKGVLILYSVSIIHSFMYHKEKLKPQIVLAVLCVILMNVGIQSNIFIVEKNLIAREHLAWGEIRSEALDCAKVEYNEKTFSDIGLSFEQYWAMYNAFYYDKSQLQITDFKKLISLNKNENKYNFKLGKIYQDFKNDYIRTIGWSNIPLIICLCLIVTCFINSDDKMMAFFLFIILCLYVTLFYVIQRPLYRVIMPGVMYVSFMCVKNIKICITKGNIICWVIIALFVSFRLISYDLIPKTVYSDKKNMVLDYIVANNGCIYMAGDVEVFSVGRARSIYDYTAKHGFWNIMGNWEIYGPPYKVLMNIYKLDESRGLLMSSLDSNKVLIITTQGDMFPEKGHMIISWLKKYYNIDAKFEMVDIIDGTNNDIGENWMVYKIITEKDRE